MSDVTVDPARSIGGEVRVGGDKSISHRALILGAMARGRSYISNLSESADVAATVRCLEACGASLRRFGADGRIALDGAGWGVSVQSPPGTLDCANSGTTMRLLAGVLAGHDVSATLDGDQSLRRRPMERVAVPLCNMGADLRTAPGGTAPITVRGRSKLQAQEHRLEIASAQVKSAILLAGLSAEGETVVIEATETRDHTERLLRLCGVSVQSEGGTVRLRPGPLAPFGLIVPGDLSSAAPFFILAAAREGATVQVPNVGTNPGRIAVLEILGAMGAAVRVDAADADSVEPVATVTVTGRRLQGTTIDGARIPRCIDELPLLALAATQAHGVTTIADAAELRGKESDRIAQVVAGLRALGADVEEHPDGMVISGPTKLRGTRLDAAGDHRLAMTWAVAGRLASGPVTIVGAECVAVSYPRFFADLAAISRD